MHFSVSFKFPVPIQSTLTPNKFMGLHHTSHDQLYAAPGPLYREDHWNNSLNKVPTYTDIQVRIQQLIAGCSRWCQSHWTTIYLLEIFIIKEEELRYLPLICWLLWWESQEYWQEQDQTLFLEKHFPQQEQTQLHQDSWPFLTPSWLMLYQQQNWRNSHKEECSLQPSFCLELLVFGSLKDCTSQPKNPAAHHLQQPGWMFDWNV